MVEKKVNPTVKNSGRLSNPFGEIIDKRARIRAFPGQEAVIYGDPSSPGNPMAILHQTNGIVFPYAPDISYNQSPIWEHVSLVHTIQQYYYYTGAESPKIDVSCTFTAQNEREAKYLLAVFHFLRSYSKMHFGETDPKRGLPPPILLFDAYGDYIFNGLPVLILNWNFSFPSDVDYVRVDVGRIRKSRSTSDGRKLVINEPASLNQVSQDFTGVAYLPARNTVSISLVVQRPPTKLRREFNLQDFREGKLLGRKNRGWT